MDKRTIIFIVIIILAAGVGIYFLLQMNNQPTSRDLTSDGNLPGNNQGTDLAKETVVIKDSAFKPDVLTIKVDTEVTWINEDSAPHQVVIALNENSRIESKVLQPGDKYVLTFREKDREYDYHCGIHPQMLGKIIVEK